MYAEHTGTYHRILRITVPYTNLVLPMSKIRNVAQLQFSDLQKEYSPFRRKESHATNLKVTFTISFQTAGSVSHQMNVRLYTLLTVSGTYLP